jgi:beta-ribofuranosylaminobenzene 5'-phosphate synthase
MDQIKVNTPARLHFGLLDMNGALGRIDGGIGLALGNPASRIAAAKSSEVTVTCADVPAMCARVKSAVTAVCEAFDLPGAAVVVESQPLPHVGLGSSTQILVGCAKAVCHLYGLTIPASELAGIVGRGGTSGIGIGTIQTGGFILDGGHRFRSGASSKQDFTPTSASQGNVAPPILARYDFPDWDILIMVPTGEGASGNKEAELFKEACPVPLDEVREMCHIVLSQILPSVVEANLEMFGAGMENFQKLGFKAFEFKTHTDRIQNTLDFMREGGGQGCGMSSWGPALFAFGEDLSSLHQRAESWLTANGGGTALLTRANNTGMSVE